MENVWVGELLFAVACIIVAVRLGGGLIMIGGFSCVGVLVLTFAFRSPLVPLPLDILPSVLAMILSSAVLSAVGGTDWFVAKLGRSVFKRFPSMIIFLGPMVASALTILSGSGNSTLLLLPLVNEIATSNGVSNHHVLTLTAVAGAISVSASPISSVVVYSSSLLSAYSQILMVQIPSCCIANLIVSIMFYVVIQRPQNLEPRFEPKESLPTASQDYESLPTANQDYESLPTAKKALGGVCVAIFVSGVLCCVVYGLCVERWPYALMMQRSEFVFCLMALTNLAMMLVSGLPGIPSAELAGALTCVYTFLTVVWMCKSVRVPWQRFLREESNYAELVYPVIAFLCGSLVVSQTAAAAVMIDLGIRAGVSQRVMIASLPLMTSFLQPVTLLLLRAVDLDKSISQGRWLVDNSFFLVGLLNAAIAASLGYGLSVALGLK